MIRTQRTIRAFTIIELIVAVIVSTIMLFLINLLFNSASDAVSLGVATSDVIGNARAIGDQIERDASNMLGNPSSGVMIIANQRYTGITYVERRFEKTRSFRSDQFVFVRSKGGSGNNFGSQPICPTGDDTFSPPTNSQMANLTMIRVWYGHVLKTGDTGAVGTAIGAAGDNRVANQLALGRHLLYMVPGAPAINKSTGGWYDATVSGITIPGGGNALHRGTTDVADFAYLDPTNATGTMVGDTDLSTSGAPANTLWADIANNDYKTRALNYTFLNQRLSANPNPNTPNFAGDKKTLFTPGAIAQMHPILSDYCSDFIVEFAGDYTDEGNDGIADGRPDTENLDGTGDIVWYGLEANTATKTHDFGSIAFGTWLDAANYNPRITGTAGGAPYVAYVFRHDQNGEDFWPYLVRIRYRLHDRRGELLGDRSPEPDQTNVGKWYEQIIVIPR